MRGDARHRLFVALRAPRPFREALRARLGGGAGARWQDDDRRHRTLRFIGEVDARVADEVAMALARAASALRTGTGGARPLCAPKRSISTAC